MTTVAIRACENCGADIGHKRSNARFCDRTCKMKGWHTANRATPEGRAREKERNTARYARERDRRKAQAKAYYRKNLDTYVERSRLYRQEHKDRRRSAADLRHQRMVSNPGYCHFGAGEWERLKRRHDYACAYCGTKGVELHQDHVIPLSRGGRHAIANILPACQRCNSSKATSLLAEWRYKRP
jgi:5-methylcytosine-specific restriction endonuclease McrA